MGKGHGQGILWKGGSILLSLLLIQACTTVIQGASTASTMSDMPAPSSSQSGTPALSDATSDAPASSTPAKSGTLVSPDATTPDEPASSSPTAQSNSSENPDQPNLPPVTDEIRADVLSLVGVAYPLNPPVLVEVEQGEMVEGTPCYNVYVTSANGQTTTTLEMYAVNLSNHVVYRLDRVSGLYEKVAEVARKDEIDAALETIMSSPMASSNPEDYLKAHPSEVEALLEMGEEALPYLLSLYDNGDRGLRGVLALTVCTQMQPQVNRASSVSPDGRYLLETYGVDMNITAAGLYPAAGIRLVERETGKALWSTTPGYYRCAFLWSPDSHYVSVYAEARTEGGTVLLEMETLKVIHLPTPWMLEAQAKQDIAQHPFRSDPYVEALQWVDDIHLQVGFRWVDARNVGISGRFVFDATSSAITDFILDPMVEP